MHTPPVPSRAQAKRDAILTAAQRLFPQYGFAGTSMDAVALAAHVSKQTLYRYHANKEALFVATLQQMVFAQNVLTLLDDLREAPISSLTQLESALVTWAQALAEQTVQPEYIALVRVLIAELPRFPALGSVFFSTLPQEGAAVLSDLLASAIAHGVIAPLDMEAAIFLFNGAIVLRILAALVRPDSLAPPFPVERVTALVRLFLHGIAADPDNLPATA